MTKYMREKLYKTESLKEFMRLTNIHVELDMVRLLIVGLLVSEALELEKEQD